MPMINLKYQKIRARVHFEVFMIDVISTDSAAWSASFHAIEAPAGKKLCFLKENKKEILFQLTIHVSSPLLH